MISYLLSPFSEEDYDLFISSCYNSIWQKVGWGSSKRYFPVYTYIESTLRFLDNYRNRFCKSIIGPLNFCYIQYNKRIRNTL